MSDDTKTTPETEKKKQKGFADILAQMDPLARVALVLQARTLYRTQWDRMQKARAEGDEKTMMESGSLCWLILAGVEFFTNGEIQLEVTFPKPGEVDAGSAPSCFRPIGGKR